MTDLVECSIPEQRELGNKDGIFPLALRPASGKSVSASELSVWVAKHRAELRAKARRHGAVLVRGCNVGGAEDFASVSRSLNCADYHYIGGAAPRTELVPGIVSTTQESPPDQPIPFHHTLAQAPTPPAYVLFFCETASKEGGATPIMPSSEVAFFFESNFPKFAQRVATHGVRYIRVMPEVTDPMSTLGRSWKDTYNATTREEAESAMRAQGTSWEWLPNGDCRTTTAVLPALRTDGRTGRRVFFNSVIAAFTGWYDARNDGKHAVVLGDGSPLDAEALDAVASFVRRKAVAFKWQQGDVLIIDNTVVLHGQDAYVPPRRILSSLRGPPLDSQNVEDALNDNTHLPVLKMGIIGTGAMGKEHIRNIALLGEKVAVVSAIADPVENSRKEALIDLGDRADKVLVFENYVDLLASDQVDAVVICAPNFRHVEVVRHAIETNKHVLCEKPLCTTIEDCEIVEQLLRDRRAKAAKENSDDIRQGVFMTAMEYRWMPPISKLIRETDSGALGSVRTITVREHRFPFLEKVNNWNRFNRYTGGTLVEKACHFFDLMRRISRSDPVKVYASGGQAMNHKDEDFFGEKPDILDHAFVTVEFASGCRAVLDLCMFAEDEQTEQVIAVCEKGKVEAKAPESTVRVLKRKNVTGLGRAPPLPDQRSIPEVYKLPVPQALADAGFHEGATFHELCEFTAAAKGLRPTPITAFDGKFAVLMGCAAQESIRTGRVMRIHNGRIEVDQGGSPTITASGIPASRL